MKRQRTYAHARFCHEGTACTSMAAALLHLVSLPPAVTAAPAVQLDCDSMISGQIFFLQGLCSCQQLQFRIHPVQLGQRQAGQA